MKQISKADVETWLYAKALPFWAEHGIDPSGHGAWEALSHEGSPLVMRDKRIRVHPRQAYVFAKAVLHGHPQYLPIAQALFDYSLNHGLDARSGRLIDVTKPDGQVVGQPNRLYDLAFVLLAGAALTQAGRPQAKALSRVNDALLLLANQEGWDNDCSKSVPRAQNPHMHLFEATTELFAATGDTEWKNTAAQILDLFRTRFLQENGAIFEFFEQDWRPVRNGQQVEPGHLFEWIWLLAQYEHAIGEDADVNIEAIYQTAVNTQNANGHFPDTSIPESKTCRLWVQCEAIKASIIMANRSYNLPETATPQHLMSVFFDSYLRTPVEGGWYDKLDQSGEVISDDMPSSSFYHIYGALQAYLDLT